MIEQLADRIAWTLYQKADSDHKASIEVLRFALIIMLQGILIVFISLIIGWFTGRLTETAITIGAFVILRMVSGGIHLNSSLACTIVSVGFMSLIPHVKVSAACNQILMYVSIILALSLAPSNIKGHSRIDSRYYPSLKFISVGIIALNFIVMSPIVTLAFFVQTLTLIPLRRNS